MTPVEVGQWFPESFGQWPVWLQVITLIGLSFVSEDFTCIGAALLAYANTLPLWVAWTGAFVGIWLGDALLYCFARLFGARLRRAKWAQGVLDSQKVREAESWFQKRGLSVLWICRWIPGTRLPSYLAAGFVALPFSSFLVVTGFMAVLWTIVVFVVTSFAGAAVWGLLRRFEFGTIGLAILAALLFGLMKWLPRSRWWPSQRELQRTVARWTQWEFWPPWLFYPPVGVFYLYLAFKYRGLSLPTVSNPGIETGGMIGEAKLDLLEQLARVAPEHTAEAFLIEGTSASARLESLRSILNQNGWTYPVVIKPDVGQRGSGVKKVQDEKAAEACIRPDGFRLIVQRYCPGPEEAGVFYYRLPDEERGRIFAITHKEFPHLVGDGKRSLAELIDADERARLMSPIYRRRFKERLEDVLVVGETLRLVEAGNHAQGCIFRDGMSLLSVPLEEKIDQISRALNGFYVGRYDIRYESVRKLKEEAAFSIVELNGASSEATSIYDPENRLFSAYRTLFQQWEIVFRIGATNRARGVKPLPMRKLWKLWRHYQIQSRGHLVAD